MKCERVECCCRCKNQVLLMDDKSNNAFGVGCIAFLDEKMVYCGEFEHNETAGCEMWVEDDE